MRSYVLLACVSFVAACSVHTSSPLPDLAPPDLALATSSGPMVDACTGVTCTAPPAGTCIDASTARAYVPTGVCSDGACTYAHTDTLCVNGCSAGACQGADPCNGVTCNAPPAAACLDASTLRSSSSAGTCSGGTCSYSSTDTTCAFGCDAGACKGDPCGGKICDSAPASACLDGNSLRSYQANGTCSAGSCSYASHDTSCAFGCTAGACKGDPCAAVSCEAPPAAACIDATSLRVYSSTGTCSNGSCTYGSSTTMCANGCAAGACKGDPCAGITCDRAPMPSCTDATTLRTYAAAGTCNAGACSYMPTSTTCAYGCAAGACAPPPCGGGCGTGFICGPSNTCVATPAPPRFVTPLSTSLNPTRPIFRWITADNSDDNRVEICTDRACAHVVVTLTGTTGATPSSDLAPGSYFFRGFGRRTVAGQPTLEGTPGPTWVLFVSHLVRTGNPSLAATSDFDGDGRADLAVVGSDFAWSEADTVRVYGAPNGGFDQTLTSSTQGVFTGPTVTAGDLNGDGYADLVTIGSIGQMDYSTTPATYPSPDLLVYFGSGAGLVSKQRIVLPHPGQLLDIQAIGDMDGDGYADILVLESDPPAPGFGIPTTVSATIMFGGCGNATVVSGSAIGCGNDTTGLLYGGLSTRSATTTWTVDMQYGYPTLVVLGDIDGDGITDVALDTRNSIPEVITVYLGASNGFSTTPTFPGGYRVLQAVGDVNGDGLADAIVQRNQVVTTDNTGFPTIVTTAAPVVLLGGAGGLSVSRAIVLNYPVTPTTDTSCIRPPGTTTSNLQCYASGTFYALGDLNGDGYGELGMVATMNVPPTGTFPWRTFERLFIYPGSASGSALSWTQEIDGPDDASNLYDSYFASRLTALGDVDGDGFDDLGITAFGWHAVERSWNDLPPKVRLYTGSSNGLVSTPKWTLTDNGNPAYNSGFGSAILGHAR